MENLGQQIVNSDKSPFDLLLIFALASVAAYFISKFVTNGIVWFAQRISVRADETSREDRAMQLRRVETYLSVTIAVVRFVIVLLVVYIVWWLVGGRSSSTFAAISASTVFIVLGAATIGTLLKDITAGATMIIEKWFTVGDYIRVEPFVDINGVVERVTLRSTKLRDLSGEVIWLHNQHMQAVSVTPRGLRTEAVDIFVDNLQPAIDVIEELSKTLQTGPTLMASPMRIRETEQITDKLWRITIVGQTIPGREWLIENFFTSALKDADRINDSFSIIYGPLVHYVDETAEKRFKRAVRLNNK